MIKERQLTENVSQFLASVAPTAETVQAVKPYPESKLHEMSFDELKTQLHEARRVQHLIPQFSAKEAEHFAFLDEATAVLGYKKLEISESPVEQIDELSRATLKSYTDKAAMDVADYKKTKKPMSSVYKRIQGSLQARDRLKTKVKLNSMDEEHNDEAEDKKLIKKMVKKDSLKTSVSESFEEARQLCEDADPGKTYKIVRMYNKARSHTIKRGLSLEDAQKHCADPETSSTTAKSASNIKRTQRMGHWFDGYDHDK